MTDKIIVSNSIKELTEKELQDIERSINMQDIDTELSDELYQCDPN